MVKTRANGPEKILPVESEQHIRLLVGGEKNRTILSHSENGRPVDDEDIVRQIEPRLDAGPRRDRPGSEVRKIAHHLGNPIPARKQRPSIHCGEIDDETRSPCRRAARREEDARIEEQPHVCFRPSISRISRPCRSSSSNHSRICAFEKTLGSGRKVPPLGSSAISFMASSSRSLAGSDFAAASISASVLMVWTLAPVARHPQATIPFTE